MATHSSSAHDDRSSTPLPADLAAEVAELAAAAVAQADASGHGEFAVEIAGAHVAGELAREAGIDPLDAIFGN